MVVNLYKEMMAVFKPYKITERAIEFVSVSSGYIPIAEFIGFAKGCNYENGHGPVYIDPSLKIVGRTFWLSRGSYDGKEGWIMHKHPMKPGVQSPDAIHIYNGSGFLVEEGCGTVFYGEGDKK